MAAVSMLRFILLALATAVEAGDVLQRGTRLADNPGAEPKVAKELRGLPAKQAKPQELAVANSTGLVAAAEKAPDFAAQPDTLADRPSVNSGIKQDAKDRKMLRPTFSMDVLLLEEDSSLGPFLGLVALVVMAFFACVIIRTGGGHDRKAPLLLSEAPGAMSQALPLQVSRPGTPTLVTSDAARAPSMMSPTRAKNQAAGFVQF